MAHSIKRNKTLISNEKKSHKSQNENIPKVQVVKNRLRQTQWLLRLFRLHWSFLKYFSPLCLVIHKSKQFDTQFSHWKAVTPLTDPRVCLLQTDNLRRKQCFPNRVHIEPSTIKQRANSRGSRDNTCFAKRRCKSLTSNFSLVGDGPNDIVVILRTESLHVNALWRWEANGILASQVDKSLIAVVAVFRVRVDHRDVSPFELSARNYINGDNLSGVMDI